MLIASTGFFVYIGVKSWLKFSWMPIILILLWIFGTRGADKATQNLIYETESAYNYIQVIERNDYRYLRLNDGQGVHSIYHPHQLNYYGPWSQVVVAPFFNPAPHSLDSIKKIAIIGLAGGTSARQADAVYGNIQIDGFEIDPKIVAVGSEYLGMTQPNINIFTQDGRWGLAHSSEHYDIISVDAYRPPYIPWHMTTVDFFEIVRTHLDDDGVMVINIGRSPMDRAIINDLATTIRQVFPTIFVMDVPESFNTILFASKHAGSWENFYQNFVIISKEENHPLLGEAMQMTINNRQETPPITRVYTDDWAPIEWLTNKVVVDFILSGGTELLK
jgi:spermidine synthase